MNQYPEIMGGKGNWGRLHNASEISARVCVCVLMIESGLGGGVCIVGENWICTL